MKLNNIKKKNIRRAWKKECQSGVIEPGRCIIWVAQATYYLVEARDLVDIIYIFIANGNK